MVRGEVDCGDSWRLPSCSGLANVVAIVIHVAILFKLSMVFLMVFFVFIFIFLFCIALSVALMLRLVCAPFGLAQTPHTTLTLKIPNIFGLDSLINDINKSIIEMVTKDPSIIFQPDVKYASGP